MVGCIIGGILAYGNQIFNIGDYRLIQNALYGSWPQHFG